MWRKNRSTRNFTSCAASGVPDDMSNGIDLNRNFDFVWMSKFCFVNHFRKFIHYVIYSILFRHSSRRWSSNDWNSSRTLEKYTHACFLKIFAYVTNQE